MSLEHLEEARHYIESSYGDAYPLVINMHQWETMISSLVDEKCMVQEDSAHMIEQAT